jgi:uncharacterized protein (DUF2132 family)
MPHSLVIDHQHSKEQATSIFRDEVEAAYWYLSAKLHSVTCHKTTLFNKLRQFQVMCIAGLFSKVPDIW